jgi:hypothetical protein
VGNFEFQNHDRNNDGDHSVTEGFESALVHADSLSWLGFCS